MSGFEEFHLGENIYRKSGGILTSFSMSEDEAANRQKRVAGILERKSGIVLREDGEEVIGDINNVRESNMGRVRKLLEENSILIDALHYLKVESTRGWKSISDIINTISLLKIQIMSARGEEKAGIYNFIDINIGEIIFDLTHDLKLGKWKATEGEIEELRQLSIARESFLSFINKPRAVMIGG